MVVGPRSASFLAATVLVMIAGCFSAASDLGREKLPATAVPASWQVHREINRTLPTTVSFCAFVCFPVPQMHRDDVPLTNVTLLGAKIKVSWPGSPPLCDHLRFALYHWVRAGQGASGSPLVFKHGPSALTMELTGLAVPLNETSGLQTQVMSRENFVGYVGSWSNREVNYRVEFDFDVRDTVPSDWDAYGSRPVSTGPSTSVSRSTTVVPPIAPYAPTCA